MATWLIENGVLSSGQQLHLPVSTWIGLMFILSQGSPQTSGCPHCPVRQPPANCSHLGVLSDTAEKLRAPELVLCALWSVPECEIVQLGIFFFTGSSYKVRSQAGLLWHFGSHVLFGNNLSVLHLFSCTWRSLSRLQILTVHERWQALMYVWKA